jgi:hypothetical protein
LEWRYLNSLINLTASKRTVFNVNLCKEYSCSEFPIRSRAR